jgi:hypothetical protein
MNNPFESILESLSRLENKVDKLQELAGEPAPITTQHPEDLATRAEALKYLRITGATLWRWEKQGKVKSYGMGGKRYYRLSELEQSITKK